MLKRVMTVVFAGSIWGLWMLYSYHGVFWRLIYRFSGIQIKNELFNVPIYFLGIASAIISFCYLFIKPGNGISGKHSDIYFEIYIAVVLFLVILAFFCASNFLMDPGYIRKSAKALTVAIGVMAVSDDLLARIREKKLRKSLLIYGIEKNFSKSVGRGFGGCVALFALVLILLARVYFGWRQANQEFILIGLAFVILTAVVIGLLIQFNMILKRLSATLGLSDGFKPGDGIFILEFKDAAEKLARLETDVKTAVENQMKSERLKTELITNVSHDIKTPLTSVINYIDLLKKEKIQNENVSDYLEVLDRKSQRLKILIEDLTEASKAGTGNLPVEMKEINLNELLSQVSGDYDEAFQKNDLILLLSVNSDMEETWVLSDGRHLYRIMENLLSNAAKYSMPSTRVYAEIKSSESLAYFTLKNISQDALNIDADELMERFVRGDLARSSEGSGLGLYIARSLATLIDAKIELIIDGDMFTASVAVPLMK